MITFDIIADDDGDQITIEADDLAVYLTITPADEDIPVATVALKAVHLDRFSRALNEALPHVEAMQNGDGDGN